MLYILILLLAAVAFVVSIVMALRNAATREWRFELSGVIGGAMTAIGRAPLIFVGFAMLTGGVPIGSLFMSEISIDRTWQAELAVFVLASIVYLFSLVMMVGTAVDALRDDVRLASVFKRALAVLPGSIVVSLIYWIAFFIGLGLFIVPGVILACVWMLVLPVIYAERSGPFGALMRSAALTKGVRWHLFLLAVIAFFFVLFVQGLLGGVSLLLGGGIVSMTVYVLASALLGMLPPALVASAYHALVTAKEGAGTSELERVFA